MPRLKTLSFADLLSSGNQTALMEVIRDYDQKILDLVEGMAGEVKAILNTLPGPGIGAITRRAMYIQQQQQIYDLANQMWIGDIPETVTSGLRVTTQLATNANQQLFSLLSATVPSSASYLSHSMYRTADIAFADLRSRFINDIDLSPTVYRNAALTTGKIDTIVNDGILAGASAAEIASDVEGYINPSTPGGAKYAAQRLGRTELNNAYRTTSKNSYIQSPYVTAVQWVLSGSHPDEDDCDELANADDFGLGPGVYPPAECPDGPHPNCFCYEVPITPSPEQFENNLENGVYDCG